MLKKRKLSYLYSTLFVSIFSVPALASVNAESCHPTANSNLPQYIVGYGSLISETSKRKTVPKAGDNLPVNLKGYKRGWFLKGIPTGFSATFLGVKADKNAQINAVVFHLPDPEEIKAFDIREAGYCRLLVEEENLEPLINKKLTKAQYWIYVPQEKQMALASEQFPIVQSYVDLFVSGCLELEKNYNLNDFAKNCIATTSDWSTHWENDRLYPRRPWAYEPKALDIDKLLAAEVKETFNTIKLE